MIRRQKRILLISYAFSPLAAAEAILNAKLTSCIKDYEIDVLTIEPTSFGLNIDTSIKELTNGRFKILPRVEAPIWLSKAFFALSKYLFPFPDRFCLINGIMLRRALEADLSNYDLIMTWSQWHSVHLVGARSKKYRNVKWVAHFSDPWADNPFLPEIKILRTIQLHFEKKVFSNADQLHFTSSETLNFVMRRYSAEIMSKSFVVPHCFEEASINRKLAPNSDEIIMRYMGNFYGQRNPINFLEAVAQLNKETPETLKKVRIEFYGKWIDSRNALDGISETLHSHVSFHQPVGYLESVDLMAKSNILLIIDAPFDESIFLPSKLIDYMSVHRPILGITPKGTTAKVIKKYGGIIASPHSVDSIRDGLVKALNEYRNGSFLAVNKNFAASFEVEAVGAIYKKCFEKIIDRKK